MVKLVQVFALIIIYFILIATTGYLTFTTINQPDFNYIILFLFITCIILLFILMLGVIAWYYHRINDIELDAIE